MTQDAAISSAKVTEKNYLLKNGNAFLNPIHLDGRQYMLKNTCPFDSNIQIQLIMAIDIPRYLKHIEDSLNETCGFVLVFLEHGAVNHVYYLRCFLLKDMPQRGEEKELNENKVR